MDRVEGGQQSLDLQYQRDQLLEGRTDGEHDFPRVENDDLDSRSLLQDEQVVGCFHRYAVASEVSLPFRLLLLHSDLLHLLLPGLPDDVQQLLQLQYPLLDVLRLVEHANQLPGLLSPLLFEQVLGRLKRVVEDEVVELDG